MITAITVTYNGSETLEKTVKALIDQSVLIDHIIIVDNASSAGHLKQILEMKKLDKRITHLRLNTNTGGAGGFQAGMEYALKEYNPDWYWLMDDDAYPDKDCLKNLLEYQQYSDNIGCLVPLIWGIDLNDHQLYHYKKLSCFLVKDKPIANRIAQLGEVTAVDTAAFVGPLISKQAVRELGVADGSLFIYGDDLEYTYRISRRFDMWLIKKAIINHRDPLSIKQKTNPKEWWKEYYMLRNRILFVHKYQVSKLGKMFSDFILLCEFYKKIVCAFILPRYRGLRLVRYKVLIQGYKDGKAGISGAIIQPSNFGKWLEQERVKR